MQPQKNQNANTSAFQKVFYHRQTNTKYTGHYLSRIVLLSAAIFFSVAAQSQVAVENYLESIRDNKAALTAFFAQMPKGGDLHNHLTGSIYTETYINYVVDNDYYINVKTLDVADKPGSSVDWQRFSTLKQAGQLDTYKQKLIQVWSVKDYNGVSYPSDKLFFETFGKFGVASSKTIEPGLLELKERAKVEHVSYIETSTGVGGDDNVQFPRSNMDDALEYAENNRDTALTFRILDTIYNAIIDPLKPIAAANNKYISDMHRRLGIDDDDFTLRYQFAFVRTIAPTLVFRKMVLAFQAVSTDTSKLVVGVNILAPENNDISMRDYWLHMQMFKYCRAKAQFKEVKCSLHAGELVLGMVKPEELSWHIYDAVRVAGADRIGHGVDIPYEHDCYDLLRYMASHKVAVEINLYSNQFILHVQDDRHPITLYKQFGVPITINTDDEGVLRSDLIEQYVILANRYHSITYKDIKQFVYNSIEYSFIRDPKLKAHIKSQLDTEFAAFEKMIAGIPK
ncbi:MAG TPA: hypothetical protein VG738_22525 [Chitinophagaceae bacterium]|nr:hypothetical protein [Chitinophagaceae bacterium]